MISFDHFCSRCCEFGHATESCTCEMKPISFLDQELRTRYENSLHQNNALPTDDYGHYIPSPLYDSGDHGSCPNCGCCGHSAGECTRMTKNEIAVKYQQRSDVTEMIRSEYV